MSVLETLGVASLLFVALFTFRASRAADGVGQSPRSAIVEAWLNLGIGFSINFTANLLLIPMMAAGGHMSLAGNFWGGCIYTAISIARQYAIRRWFNARLHAAALRIAR